MLDKTLHEITLKKILKDIYTDSDLQARLVFKGGTCLYFFHDLPRFSTDLDFSLTQNDDSGLPELYTQKITDLFSQYVDITDQYNKHFTHFWSGSFKSGAQKIKIEISKRSYLSEQYSYHNLYGIGVRSFDLPTLAAHKLCALTTRPSIVSRDIFDTWWILKNSFEINQNLIQERMNQNVHSYLVFIKKFLLKNHKNTAPLAGLGEVLSESQKDWAKDHLFKDLLFHLDLSIEAYSQS